MSDEAAQPADFWTLLDEAQKTVERWPEWQQRYEADVYAAVSSQNKTTKSD